MKEYRGEEVLELIVHRLVCCQTQDKFNSEDYGAFIDMQFEEALNKLQPRLKELQEWYEKSKGRPDLYFLDELGYYHFLIELSLVEALNAYSGRVKENKEIPPLVIEDENMCVEDVASLWEEWVKKCKAQ